VREEKPDVSVILVSDYASSCEDEWRDLRAALTALACQDFAGTAEFLLVEHADVAGQIPTDVLGLLPSLRLVVCPDRGSYAMKNRGAREARADIIATVDADCRPDPGWLRALVAAFKAHPEAAAISGPTMYESTKLAHRILGLLSRSYLDPGRAGPTRFIANQNAGWKRSAFLAHELPTDMGPFASRTQSEAVLRDRGILLFEPAMRVIHIFDGWPMEVDIRRNMGYATILTRLRDPRLPYAWLTALGPLSIPLVFAGKTLNSIGDCLRCWHLYNVRWYEVPFAIAFAFLINVMEIPGMWMAFRNQKIGHTAYR